MSVFNADINLAFAEKYLKFGTWSYCPKSKQINYSKHFIELLGFKGTEEPLTVNDFAKLVDNPTKSIIINEVENAIQNQNGFEISFSFNNNFNKVKTAILKASVEKNKKEKTIQLCGILKVEDTLDLSKEINRINKLEKLMESSFNAFLIINERFEPNYISKATEDLLGYKTTELEKKNFIQLLHTENVNAFLHRILESEKNMGALIECEPIKIIKSNGDWIISEITITNLSSDPSINGILIHIKDITKSEYALSRLKLMESAVKNTSDAILITEAEPFDLPGPKIVYVNDAFCKMTGYHYDEIIGKTPRILQGPKSDKNELKQLSKAIRGWKRFETNLINYKKNGEEFWININISPIANSKGIFTHWVAVERDITRKKEIESEKKILLSISKSFLEYKNINTSLSKVLQNLLQHTQACMGEVWLINSNKKNIYAASREYRTENMKLFFEETKFFSVLEQAYGVPGIAWKNKEIQYWENLNNNPDFVRKEAAEKYGLKSIYTIPLIENLETIGVLCLGLEIEDPNRISFNFLNNISQLLAAEITRKQLDIQLKNIFNASNDIIVIVGFDGLIKKANPAAEKILGYSAADAFEKSFSTYVHPEDIPQALEESKKLLNGEVIQYLENRMVTKSGRVKWFAWTFSPSSEDNLIYGIGKEISEKKKLEDVLSKANNLAKIGSWEVDLISKKAYWSEITKKILEVPQDYVPNFQEAIGNANSNRKINFIKEKLDDCIKYGNSWDDEILIETFKGKWKWVRSIGDAEFLNGKCIRVYGSLQDIDDKKRIDQEIIENNERFNLVAKATTDLIWEWNLVAGEVYRLGDSFFKSLGYTENPNKINWISIIHPEDRERVVLKRKHIIENTLENYWEDQYRIVKANGANAFVLERGFIVRLSNGKAIKMTGSTQNITKLRQNEIQLSDSEKRYSNLFHLSPLPMWVYDLDTLEFLDVNEAAIKHYGYSKNEFLSMTLKDIRPAEDMSLLIDDIIHTRNHTKDFISGMFRHKKKDGTIINVDIQSNYINFKEKNARVVLANDITERLAYVNTIESKNQELQQIAWMQSHLMRAPLAKIIGIADIIKRIPLDTEEKLDLLNDLLISTKELDKVIHEIAHKTHNAKIR